MAPHALAQERLEVGEVGRGAGFDLADRYEALVTAKGDPDSVVMLAILAQMHAQMPPPGCAYDDDGKQKVRDLINMFSYHAEGDTCAPTYVPFFEKAASLVGDACSSFIPQ